MNMGWFREEQINIVKKIKLMRESNVSANA